ncbi:MAG: hypothetical protein LLG97_02115 [Deltaproteobacteria bacterium]|nr:hypothetical protein [Deltaproteobacteria bacterium]
MDLKIVLIMLAATVALLLIIVTYSGERYGELRPNEEVTQAFRTDPGKDYYLSGPDPYPNAIMGIDKSWMLEGDLWKRKDLTAGGMEELVGNMRSKAAERGGFLQGFDILDDRGRKIGEWLSAPGMNATVWMKGGDRVAISTPPLNVHPDR